MAETDCLAEAGYSVDRSVEHRDLMTNILEGRVHIENGLVEDLGHRREDAAGADETIAGCRRSCDRVQQVPGSINDVTGIVQHRSDGAGTGRVGYSAGQIRDQVAGLADMTEADRLTEVGQAMERSVQRRDFMPDLLQLGMRIEDDLVGRVGQRVGERRFSIVCGADVDGTLDKRSDRAEARELAGRKYGGG